MKRRKSNVLAQLRTGMARVNGYLHKMGVADTVSLGDEETRR